MGKKRVRRSQEEIRSLVLELADQGPFTSQDLASSHERLGRGGPVGPESNPNSILGFTKWLIQEIKIRP